MVLVVTPCWTSFEMVHYPGISAAANEGAPLTTIPTFIAAGAGSGTAVDTNPLTPGAPAGIVNGNLLITQVGIRSSVSGTTCSTPAGWVMAYNDLSPTSSRMRQFIFTRIYNGTFDNPSFTWSAAAGTTPAARARIYGFAGAANTTEGGSSAGGTADATIEIPSVTTIGPNRLVVAFASAMGLVDAIGDATGESGGDYTRPVTGFSTGGGNAIIMIQTAPMAAAGVISDGVIDVSPNTPNWVVRSFAILPL
jgi:hypothetical protein